MNRMLRVHGDGLINFSREINDPAMGADAYARGNHTYIYKKASPAA